MEAERYRVLIVDDEPQVCSMMADLLSPEIYDVVCTQSGIDAQHLISQQGFDVVVSDVRLPGLQGLELLRAVREQKPDLPFILVSDAPDVDSAMEAIEFGVLRYLGKPVDAQEFRDVVRRAVELDASALPKRRARSRRGRDAIESTGSGYHLEFRQAIGSLWMAYQPIVSVASGATVACEALVRSNDEMLPDPGALLEAAESLNRMVLLGRKIRERVAADLSSFSSAELVFVNLHPQELDDDQLYTRRDPLTEHAQRVVLEITERSQLDNVRNLAERLRRLCDMGYRIALDDLGAGYAGLSSLMQLNPHFVKLDMSLTRDINLHAVKQKLVNSMFQVCKEMGVAVVSEGVERIEEREMLRALGGDLMQGYLFGKPAPPAAILQPVRTRQVIDQP